MNVSLREFKLVPKPEESIVSHTETSQVVAEIGFDPKTNDYKVFFLKDYSTYLKQGERQAAVYNVSSNSWKKLNDPLLDHVDLWATNEYNFDTYVDGNVHWLANEVDDAGHDCMCILAFDMVNEAFAKIEFPADLRIYCIDSLYAIAVFNECLSVTVYPQGSDTVCFDVWVMKDYGNERSWTKEFIIGPVEDVEIPLGIWRNGEFLIKHKRGYTISYDPSTQKIEQLCFGEGFYLNKSRIYTESLVSVTGNAPNDYKIIVEDYPFTMTPDVIENIFKDLKKMSIF